MWYIVPFTILHRIVLPKRSWARWINKSLLLIIYMYLKLFSYLCSKCNVKHPSVVWDKPWLINMQTHQLNMTLQPFSDWVMYKKKCRCAFRNSGLPLLTHPLNFALSCVYADNDFFALQNLNVHMVVTKAGMWLCLQMKCRRSVLKKEAQNSVLKKITIFQ